MSVSSRTRSKLKEEEEKSKQEEAISLWRKLPEGLSEEIFLKLPGNSILSSRSVCKLFNTRLSEPIFVKNHVNLSIRSKNSKTKLLFRRQSRFNPSEIYSLPIDTALISSSSSSRVVCDGAVLMNYPFESSKIYRHRFLGSCNGLICLEICRTDRVDYEKGHVETTYFSILNPFTRQFKEFSMQTVNRVGFRVAYGFGYDSDIDDYKLIAISDNVTTGCSNIKIYTVRSGLRSSIQGNVKYSFYDGIKSHAVFLSGCLHWLGSIATQAEAILCFDIRNGIMGNIPLPQNIIPPTDFSGDVQKNVGVLGDNICVAFIWESVRLDVWVMRQYRVMESWIKTFTTTQLPRSLLWPFWKPLLCLNDGKILVDYTCNQLLLFDPTAETVRSVVVRHIAMDDYRESCVETIASLGSSTFLERQITDETTKNPKRRRRLR